MTSLDEVFQKSGLRSKRMRDPMRDPTTVYKAAKNAPTSHAASSRHQARVGQDCLEDQEAGPAPPPGDDNDDADADRGPSAPPEDGEAASEDEEGRFFGGGITATEKLALDYINDDEPASAADETLDAAWARKRALALERAVTRNAEQRARFTSEPARFMDSEAALDGEVRALSLLAEAPSTWGAFAAAGGLDYLVGLLSHDNADVAIAAARTLGDLTGEDSGVPAGEAEWTGLVDKLLASDLIGLLASNLLRLDEETEEADRDGVYHCLCVVENLCLRTETAERIVGENEHLLTWLLARAQKCEQPVTQNKQYAAELLAIVVQTSRPNRRVLIDKLDAVDVLLQLVAPYRHRDPEKGGDEAEYMENLFEALACLVDEPQGKAKFVEAEGMELCLIMLKYGGKKSKAAALRLVDHAVGGSMRGDAVELCRRLVAEGGLKTTFTLFMKKHDGSTIEHLVGIFCCLLRLLPASSAERLRTLAKFVEKDYEKTARLVRFRREYAGRVAATEAQIELERRGLAREHQDIRADEWFSRRLDAGLFALQTIDVILAWLVAEDDGAKKAIRDLLADRHETLELVKATIQEQIEAVDVEAEEGKETREMLSTLLEFL